MHSSCKPLLLQNSRCFSKLCCIGYDANYRRARRAQIKRAIAAMIGGGRTIFDNLAGQRAAVEPFGQSAPQLAFAAHPLSGNHQKPDMTLPARLRRQRRLERVRPRLKAEPVQIKPRFNRQSAARQTAACARHQGRLGRCAHARRRSGGRLCPRLRQAGVWASFRQWFLRRHVRARRSNMAVAAFAANGLVEAVSLCHAAIIGVIGRRPGLFVFYCAIISISRPASPPVPIRIGAIMGALKRPNVKAGGRRR